MGWGCTESYVRLQRWGAATLVSLGMAVVAVGVYDLARSSSAAHWPTTIGTIEASKVDVPRCPCNPEMPNLAKYESSLTYGYTVGGIGYSSHAVSIGFDASKSKLRSREFAQRYAVGSAVKVHYDPWHPATAVLEPGLVPNAFGLPGLGLVFTALGLIHYWKTYGIATTAPAINANPADDYDHADEMQRYLDELTARQNSHHATFVSR